MKYYNSFGFKDTGFDFSGCVSLTAKAEIKYLFYYCIEQKTNTLRTITSNYSRCRHIISYINENGSIQSVLDIEENDYISFLLKNKIIKNSHVTSGSFVNADMEEVRYERKNRSITLLHFLKDTAKEVYEANIPEQEKDYWNIKKFPFLNLKQSEYKNLKFSEIPQRAIKETTKRIFFNKLKIDNPATLYNNLSAITFFLKWLGEEYPEIQNLKDLSRDVIEDYLEYMRTASGKSSTMVNRNILAVKRFLEDGYLIDKDSFPEANLFLSTDYKIRKKREADFYSDNEMKNINKALPEMPVMYATIIMCLELLALRISDLITLTPAMIEEVHDNPSYKHHIDFNKKLVKIQKKTKNLVQLPISDHVYRLLMNQYEISKKKYGKDVAYVFATGQDTHIDRHTVSYRVNKLFFALQVKNDEGDLLHFKAHKFRATKATKLIEKGFGSNEAAKALGHSSLHSLSSYATITDQTLIDNMEPYLNKVQTVIENMGNGIEEISQSTEKLLPLCNGWCSRPVSLGICEHANKCLSCTLFKPDSRHTSYYKLQLQELEATYGVAQAAENKALMEKIKADIVAVKRIITEVEKLCKQKEIQKD